MKTRAKGLIIFVLVGIILLIFSTPMVLRFSGNHFATNAIDTDAVPNDVVWSISKFTEPNGMLESVYFEGWAFDKAAPSVAGRHVSLLLKTDKHTYEIVSGNFDLPSLRIHFTDLDLNPEGLRFTGTFSTIGLRDGKYELFLKYWDEREEPVIVSTGRFFVKGRGHFEELPKN